MGRQSLITGKFDAYLRYKEIPYQRIPMTPLVRAKLGRGTGTTQMPAVRLPDGRWMTDTTPMIAWLESEHPEPAVIPRDPLQAFASIRRQVHSCSSTRRASSSGSGASGRRAAPMSRGGS